MIFLKHFVCFYCLFAYYCINKQDLSVKTIKNKEICAEL
jgi:hypothetical protein